MIDLFITIRFLDIVDVLLVAFLLYQMYMLIKGTVAINIFVGIFLVYLLWLIVKALNMQLLGTILGQFIGVGVIALIIVFQQEIRRFLLMLGSRYFMNNNKFSLERIFSFSIKDKTNDYADSIVEACIKLSSTKTGALIVISNKSDLYTYTQTGDILNADISSRLLISIFNKTSPLHDGAVIINGNKIKAARCVLPVSDNTDVPAEFGLRHRSALGMSQAADVGVIIVSEETGDFSYAKSGSLKFKISKDRLAKLVSEEF